MSFSELSPNQSRVSVEAKQTYEAYRAARRNADQYAGGLCWKRVDGHEYLIKVINRRGGTKSLGPRSLETERIHAEFVAGKARAKERETALKASVAEFAGMARSVGINRVPSIVTATLRKLDRSFEPVRQKGFRAVNKDGFYVDLVKQTPNPPWKLNEPERIAAGDLTPSWLPNIKWLLSSEKFNSIVIGLDGQPAPMVAPDPRAFAV